jgi:hypothetical protein
MVLAVLGSIILALGAAYWLASRRRPARDRASAAAKTPRRFGAVEIRIRHGACEAARALEGQRFLSRDAPALPLPGCGAPQCSCTFAKLSDRRTEQRRLEHGGLTVSMFLTSSRRQKRDRRRAE